MADTDLNVKLSLIDNVSNQLKEINNNISSQSTSMKSDFGALSKAMQEVGVSMIAMGTAIVAQLTLITKSFVDTGEKLTTMSETLGISTESLSKWGYVAEQNGTTLDALASHIVYLSRSVADVSGSSGTAQKAIQQLGLSLTQLQQMTPEQQFRTVTEAIANQSSATERLALTTSIFGRGAMDLLPILAQDTGSSGDARGWFLVNSGTTFSLSNVTLDGTGHLVYMGLYYWGNGTVDNCNITNIKYNQSGPDYMGRGIIIKGNVNVSNSTFTNMGRIGVQYYGGGGTANYNTFVGKGDGDWLDYAFDIGNGAIVTVDHNTVSGNTGVASIDHSSSAAVLVDTYFGTGTTATITNNNLNDNTIGIAVGINNSDSSSVVAHNNNLSGNFGAGIISTSSVVVDATNNWWGNTNGPGPIGPGSGDNVSTNVNYSPWLTSAPPSTVTLTATGQAAISPTVTTSAATAVAFTLATLNGNLVSKGTADSVNVSFGYDTISHSGDPSAYPNWITVGSVGTGDFSATIASGLTPGQIYYFAARAQGNDVANPVYGVETSFTTAKITTLTASSIGAYTATLNGQLDIGSATSVAVSFGYGTPTGYGTVATITTPMTGSGDFSVALTGLSLKATYQFKALGTIGSDIGSGLGQTVTLVPMIGISISPSSIDFGSIIAGHSSAVKTVTVTNTGDYNQNFSATLTNESPTSFYTDNLKINTGALGAWHANTITPAHTTTPSLVLSIPIGSPAGAKTATIIFWAESSTP